MNSTLETYDAGFVKLVEMIYGEGILSQGGFESLDVMFKGMSLDGLKMLDLGCGLGSYDLHLARHYEVEVVGLDPQIALIENARQHAKEKEQSLIGNVTFELMEDPLSLAPIPNDAFDVIFSKESILHVPLEHKENYFKEIYRVLKPGGTIVIMDWARNLEEYSDNVKKMMEMDGVVFQLLSPIAYTTLLENVGFAGIEVSDLTENYVGYSQNNVDAIRSLQESITESFGEDVFDYALESWSYQRDAFKSRELLVLVLKAYKKG